ncbi:MAG: hypothetical protein ACYDCO_13710 [Armatimonadota bacterium]
MRNRWRWWGQFCLLLLGLAAMAQVSVDSMLIDGRVIVPVRRTVEGLGGTIQYDPARHGITIMLAGATRQYALGTDAEYPLEAFSDFWIGESTLHSPAYVLARQFNLQLGWNSRAKAATLAVPQTGRTVTLPASPIPPLAAPAAGVHPLLFIMAGDGSYLMGGVAARRYRSDREMAPFLRGATRQYTLYTLTARIGTRRVGAPFRSEVGAEGWFVRVSPPARQQALGLSAPWNALPRRPRIGDPGEQAFQQMARDVLASRGITAAQPRVTQAISVDLDGNGTAERVISATIGRQDYTSNPQTGDYSFVAMQSGGRNWLLVGAFFPQPPPEFALPSQYSVGGLLDIDGDGKMEVLVHYVGYEWNGDLAYRVLRLPGERPVNLFSSFIGGI